MRLIVILSPTDKWGTKAEYTELRKFLRKRRIFKNRTGSIYANRPKQKSLRKALQKAR